MSLKTREVINKDLNGVSLSDELHSSVGSGSFTLLHNTFFGGTDLIIRTSASGGGNLLMENTDYVLENQNAALSTESGKSVYVSLRIINVNYQSGDLYISYLTVGDFTDAADYNYLNANKIDVLGWVIPQNGWSYISSSSILESGDRRDTYRPGDKIMFIQSQAFTNDPVSGSSIVLNMSDTGGFMVGNKVTVSSSAGTEETTITAIAVNTSITVASLILNHTQVNPLVSCTKYFYVASISYSSPSTTISLAAGIDYLVANAAISSPHYSKVESPIGFPDWFNWTPTHIGFSTIPSNMFAQFRMSGRTVFLNYTPGTAGVSNATTYTISLPTNLPAATITNGQWTAPLGYTYNASAIVTTPGRWVIASAGTLVTLYLNCGVGTWTASSNKMAHFQAYYPIAA
ncbi:MAG TPA: hypothetical protein DDW65_21625 [Firmicutes bacterium]|jgi:hypothetical protein|nr:hypothetical protein [Bacillota bacterium]